MSYLFARRTEFNEDISSWDTSGVVNMESMFEHARAFDIDISSWDTSSVQNMNSMFREATKFNSDLSGWDISSVIRMNDMFQTASSYNQDLCEWGDKFPYSQAINIFSNSGCTFQDSPQTNMLRPGPFCASSCRD